MISRHLNGKYQIKEWELATTNLHRISGRKYEIAVLPVGAIEAHNYHLPEGQDYLHANYVADRSCELAWPSCESVICLPPIPYGVDCNLMAYPLTIHVSQTTLNAIIHEIITSLCAHGIKKILIINSHGGNDFISLVRQIQSDMDVHVFICDWWKVGSDKYDGLFDKSDDHAGIMETSVALALYPDLVEQEVAGTGKTKEFRLEALKKGWVRTSRDFSKINNHCAVGDPSGATAEKGKKYLDLITERISTFIVELANSELDESFPLAP